MIEVIQMSGRHIDEVSAIEQACFSIPWTKDDFKREIFENQMAIYRVAILDGKVAGYAGMWHIVNEGHITNVAVSENFRKQGIGSAIIQNLIEVAENKQMIGITLEVRMSNLKAQKLYIKYGFRPEGFRKRYYNDTGEDAIIMWKYFESYENYNK